MRLTGVLLKALNLNIIYDTFFLEQTDKTRQPHDRGREQDESAAGERHRRKNGKREVVFTARTKHKEHDQSWLTEYYSVQRGTDSPNHVVSSTFLGPKRRRRAIGEQEPLCHMCKLRSIRFFFFSNH